MKKNKKRRSWTICGICMMTVCGCLWGCGAKGSGSSGAAAAGGGDLAYPKEAATTLGAENYEETGGYKADVDWEGAVEETAEESPRKMEDYDGMMMKQGQEMNGAAFSGGNTNRSMARKYQEAYGGEDYNTEEYNYIHENGYKKVSEQPLSTFSIDVDTASYGNVRRMIRSGAPVPADAVRVEEMINYFDYDYPEPKEGEAFSVTTEYGDCPWNEDHRLLLIGLKAKEIDFHSRPASNLVFLLDVSGSMYSDDKLPLVQKAFTMLAENLNANDRVSIVTYAGYESVVLDGVPGNKTAMIAAALEDLEAGGSTAGAAGIEKAYELAEKNFIPGGNNRVILATDGDLNVGISSQGGLTRLIQEKKKSGVHLSVLGVGSGNLKDNKMEALADNGDGNYSYLDSLYEAKKVLVDEMGGTLVTVAKDVKIQVEFNPEYVAGYRLVGYENRVLRNEDFNNDKVDAGEIGAGHTVTALYEIIPGGEGGQTLKYQTKTKSVGSTELLTVSLRYKAPNGNKSKGIEYPVEADSYRPELSENLMFASAVAEFGMILRDSDNRGNATFEHVMELAEACVHRDSDEYRKEFLELVQQCMNRNGFQ